ncbi:MAG: 50S ribosomal protein L13 [Chlamydiae bacterium SM23_39]|nr:MAG: 50S ribosomal protein L13 [Chlamydiae bacterium SM23_39]
MKTLFVNKEKALKEKKWFILDAEGKILGRFASEIAKILRGKHKTDFTPNIDDGDGVIVINAEKIKVTGNKENKKIYIHYTGYVGGQIKTEYKKMKNKYPERIISRAVKGMMPKNRLTEKQMKKLRVFKGEKHNMEAQNPEIINLG